jgi:Glycerophosphoryl diester phosphodiesterase
METLKIILTVIILLIILLEVLYFYAVMPRTLPEARIKAAKFKGKYIAHRGLHSSKINENTADAFRAAVDAGFGMEFDVRISSDGIPIISHDSNLKRVFGVECRAEDLTAAELQKIGVPTLAQTLEIVGGKTPLVVELKMDDTSSKVCELTAPLLKAYKGEYCVESFHPTALVRWRKLMDGDTRGQLSAPFKSDKNTKIADRFRHFVLRNLLSNFATRPDFIAYDHNGAKELSLRFCRYMGATAVAWTIRSQAELDASRKYFDTFIFENFIPENHEKHI